MGSKICMNELCRATTSSEWKKGWGLKSGEFATLCQSCGSAYEKLIFCETFHLDESGWRECRVCGKRIHCGCIASKFLHEYMDFGGIGCINCVKHAEAHSTRAIQIPGNDVDNGILVSKRIGNVHLVEKNSLKQLSNAMEANEPGEAFVRQLSKGMEVNESGEFFQSQKDEADAALRHLDREKLMLPVGEVSTCLPNSSKQSVASSSLSKPDKNKPKKGAKSSYESQAEPSLNFSLSMPLGTSSSALPFPGGVERREQKQTSSSQQGNRTRHILPKAPKPASGMSTEGNKGTPPQTRVARPPGEGRGRNQLLPRYWPRITDQELQQISGDLNSTIVPLFEKVLSASDAGRIGRLVLPKACAEAYFPHINQSEGVPIKVQDIKGKEWTFQFRFWPNNNSRMYVLEGVTPCIQNMQLEAGDTVTFSRIDPGGKLVMGFRKATNNNDSQEPKTNNVSNDGSGESEFTGVNGSLAANGSRTSDADVQRYILVPGKKKIRNIGSKNKRLLIHSEDAMELRVTWREIQELLRPPPTVQPRVISIDGAEVEEYDDPPVIGKKTIFTARPFGEQEQWAQCDSCSKWRRLPMHVLVPSKWSCSDNNWDSSRCSCSAPEDINQRELDTLQRVSNDFKRRRMTQNNVAEDCDPSGLDALATAAVLGDNFSDLGESSVGATTKHPRHRVGCSCIVCIQPPSGKGKHPPSCKCNVCLTVRRRFKTMALRKKIRQSKREAELVQEIDQLPPTNGSEMDMVAGQALLEMNYSENDRRSEHENQMEMAETSMGQLDLNYHPHHEDELLSTAAGMSITTLVNATSLPLEMYLKQNGLGSLGPCFLSQAAGDNDGLIPDDSNTSTDAEMEKKGEDG